MLYTEKHHAYGGSGKSRVNRPLAAFVVLASERTAPMAIVYLDLVLNEAITLAHVPWCPHHRMTRHCNVRSCFFKQPGFPFTDG